MRNPQQNHITKSLLIILFSIFTISTTNEAQANMFNKFKKGFYFEKYKTAEEARAALLEMHPVGSDVEELLKTLEKSKATIREKDLSNAHKFKEYDKWWDEGVERMYVFEYDGASPFFIMINYLIWSGSIGMDKNGNITSLAVFKNRAY